MVDPQQIRRDNADLCRLAGEKFSFTAQTLEGAMKKVGRRVPSYAHRHAAVLIEAERFAGHPKLSQRLDAKAIRKARGGLEITLKAVDAADRRKAAILSTLASLSFSLIAVFALLMLVLWWRGYL